MQSTACNERYRMDLIDEGYGSWNVVDTRDNVVVDCLQYAGAKELTQAFNAHEAEIIATRARRMEYATTRLPQRTS